MSEFDNWKGVLQTFVAKNLKDYKIEYTSTSNSASEPTKLKFTASVTIISEREKRCFDCAGFHGTKKLAEADAAEKCLGILSQELNLPDNVIDWKGRLQSLVVKTYKNHSVGYVSSRLNDDSSRPNDVSFGCRVSILERGITRFSYQAEGGPFKRKNFAENAAAKRGVEALMDMNPSFVTSEQLYQIGTSISSVTSSQSGWSRSDDFTQEAELHEGDVPVASHMTTVSNMKSSSTSEPVDFMNTEAQEVGSGDYLPSRISPLLRFEEDHTLLDFGDPSDHVKSGFLSSSYLPLPAFASLPLETVAESQLLVDIRSLSATGMDTRPVAKTASHSLTDVKSLSVAETDLLSLPVLGLSDLCASPASMSLVPATLCASPASMSAVPATLCASPASMSVEPATLCASPGSMSVVPATLCASPGSMPVVPATLCASPASMSVEPATLCASPASMPVVPATLCASPGSMSVVPATLCASRASGLTAKVKESPVSELDKMLLLLNGNATYACRPEGTLFISTVTVTYVKGESFIREGTAETSKAAAKKSASSVAIKEVSERERLRGKFKFVHCRTCDAELGPIAEFFFMCKSEDDVSFASEVAMNKMETFKLVERTENSKIKIRVHCVSCQNAVNRGHLKATTLKGESLATPSPSNIGIIDTFTEGAPRVAVFGYEKVVLKTVEGDVSSKKKWNQSIKDASFSLISKVCTSCHNN
jgi:hypothetical protein